jgi:hypothetical protein
MHAMLKKALPLVLLCGVVGTAALLINFSATPVRAQDVREAEFSAHLGDLMNESMQVNHTKLWLAGHANNWPLAAYEARKIRETIEQLKEAIVTIQKKSVKWQQFPVGEMLNIFDSRLEEMDKSIKDKDAGKFEAAYRQLTAACNACHIKAGEPQIKIIVPAGSGPFANQDFTVGGAQ